MIRTGADSALATQAVGSRVAFEVDNVDFWHLTGWSVVLNGRCRVLEDAGMRDLAASSLTPWVEGAKATVLTIDPISITGRRLVAAAEQEAPDS